MTTTAQQIVPGVYRINLGYVNAYLVSGADGLTLIDTGTRGSAEKILDAVRSIGQQPSDIKRIILTHLHGDHVGSLNPLKQATGAPAWMHPLDAALVRQGISGRAMVPAPGLINRIGVKAMQLMTRGRGMQIEPAEIEREIDETSELPDGMRAIHVPGHAAGQLAFLLPISGGVLIAADACGTMGGKLGFPFVFEDMAEGVRSLHRLARLEFAAICCGHGAPIVGDASARFREKWG